MHLRLRFAALCGLLLLPVAARADIVISVPDHIRSVQVSAEMSDPNTGDGFGDFWADDAP